MNIGCHLSSSNGLYAMGKDALYIGANTFQFFSRNPRGSKAKKIDKTDAQNLMNLMKENNFYGFLAHAPYTLNPCSSKEDNRKFAVRLVSDDLKRMELTPNQLYNFHPGSHTGQGVETGISQIIYLLNITLKPEQTTTVLLETMGGKGTEIGSKFEELKEIIDGVKLKDKIGVCLDTSHVFIAGYDIVNNLDSVVNEFDNIIGIDNLKAIHLNDSVHEFASHKDRHARIGEGNIGLETIKRIVTHPKLADKPFYLETPNDLEGHKQEIELVKSLI